MAPFLTINTGEEKKVKTVGGIGLDLRIPVPRFLMLATVFFFFKSMTLYRKHVFRFKCQGTIPEPEYAVIRASAHQMVSAQILFQFHLKRIINLFDVAMIRINFNHNCHHDHDGE